MRHQIRKMIALLLAVVRDVVDESVFAKVFSNELIIIPRVPGLGLVLDEIHYDSYNRRKDISLPLEWTNHLQDIEDFREKHIHPIIVDTEIREELMYKWTDLLLMHSFDIQNGKIEQMESEESSDDEHELKSHSKGS